MISPARSATHGKRNRIVIALVSVIVVSLLADGIELVVIRLVKPSEQALTWVSDLVVAVVLTVAMYLRLDLQATRMRLSRVEQEQIVVDTELSLAAEIQSGRLPKAPPAGFGFSWAARLCQARKIGGDFYDFVQVNPGKWFVILGDVSGKGVRAALLVASVQTLFRGLSQSTNDPAEILRALSKGIHDETQGGMFVTYRSFLEGDIGGLVTDGVSESIEKDGVSWCELARTTLADLKSPTAEQVCETLMKMAQDGEGPAGIADWEDDQTAVVFLVDGSANGGPHQGEES